MSRKTTETFFRVQSTGNKTTGANAFVERTTPSGGKVVTLKRDSYTAAKRAAARAIAKSKR